MKIGIIDVDSHNFPNLALMKLSAWHKARGDDVDWWVGLDKYDIVYASKVFNESPDIEECIQADEVIRGGTGYDYENKLPGEIEATFPDYRLYHIKNTAYGYLTRGCPRRCPKCIVGEKEGYKSVKVADLKQFWNGQREIKLLDPNTFACPDRIGLLQQLVGSKAWIDFTQGVDIRLITDEITDLIMQMKVKMIHFAWDREKDSDLIIKNLKSFKKATGIDRRKAAVYVLTNSETSHEFDLFRVYKLRELGFDPYIMIFDKENAPRETRMLQRWVNNKIIFTRCERFEQYDSRIG
jgi:hypothetical protein